MDSKVTSLHQRHLAAPCPAAAFNGIAGDGAEEKGQGERLHLKTWSMDAAARTAKQSRAFHGHLLPPSGSRRPERSLLP